MLFKIWERYFLRETLKMVFLIIFCFYGLYILIDYASHSSSHNYHHAHFQWKELFLYYYCEFVQRLDVLLPFALVIAGVRTLTQLNANNELMAFMAGGIKLKTLLRPFILIGLISTATIYANTEYLLPKALSELRHLGDEHALQKNKKNRRIFVQHIALKDRSTLLFQEYDSAKKIFFDTYWIRSFNEIYRIKYLSPYTKTPTGKYVDHLVRNDRGQFVKEESFEEKAFPEIRFNKKVLLDTITPPEELSLSKLWKEMPRKKGSSNEKQAQIKATFYKKLVIPWLCLIAILGPAPFCVRFSRHFPVFFIYAFSIFGLVACYLVIEAAVVLGSRQVLPAGWAIGAPFLLSMGGVLWKFARIK
ncbi:MAG: LptF/LptG family permease [Waddliaceae bacterium]